MRALSLFSGIGGLDLGLQRAGFTIAGQVEIDPWCRKVLARHWPDVPRHDDVRTAVTWWGGRAADLVCGGFPCQPVSVAGKGLAQEDSRWLWPAFADVIRHVRPRYVLVENVPGLLGRGMGDVLGDLAGLGFDAEWDRLPAVAFGAPHIRERIWIVAYAQRDPVRQQPGRGRGQDRPGPPFAADDGPERTVADPAGAGHAPDPGGVHGDAGAHRTAVGQLARRSGADVADPDSVGRVWRPGVERPRWETPVGEEEVRHAGDGSQPVAHPDRAGRGTGLGSGGPWPSPVRSSWWTAEPGMGRVASRVPGALDRLRGLGNAVVPQVAEHVGRIIADYERQRLAVTTLG